jgi:uncharacterized protein (TIGR00369 family)
MFGETGRFYLFCVTAATRDQSVASKKKRLRRLDIQRGLMAHAERKDVPVARLIGFEAKEIADERAVVTLAAGQQHANPMGTLHGGILCDIADAAMGMAFASTLAPGESFTTIELKINFFRPCGRLTCVPRAKLCDGAVQLATLSVKLRMKAGA